MEMKLMARMKFARFKKCRRLGLNVCGHPKAMDRAARGQVKVRRRLTPYGAQLLEKQKLKCYYEVMEKQFRRYMAAATKDREVTGDSLVKSLECRLDNMVYRMNFGSSIREARQMVVHRHIKVDGKIVDKPSFAVAVGSEVSLKEKSQKNKTYRKNFVEKAFNNLPYIEINKDNFTAVLAREPKRDEVPIEVKDDLIIQLYSRIL